MPVGTSVGAQAADAGQPAVYGWDWTATTHTGRLPRAMARDLVGALDPAVVLPAKGIHGWARSLEAFDAEGYKLGAVYLDGRREDVFFVASSDAADRARDHAVTVDRVGTARVDTRVDSMVPFEDLAGVLEDAAAGYGSKITRIESSQRGQSLGRTVYLGAPSSAVRVRLYEKWLESPGEYEDGTNRVEVQLRPPSKVKERVSGWTRAETFCASRVTQGVAAALGAELVPAGTLHVARATPDLERSLEVMGQQYGRAVDRWLQLSQGDIGTVLDYLTGNANGLRN